MSEGESALLGWPDFVFKLLLSEIDTVDEMVGGPTIHSIRFCKPFRFLNQILIHLFYKIDYYSGRSSNVARAVGQCMRHNPVPLFIPCHRVVTQQRTLGWLIVVVVV